MHAQCHWFNIDLPQTCLSIWHRTIHTFVAEPLIVPFDPWPSGGIGICCLCGGSDGLPLVHGQEAVDLKLSWAAKPQVLTSMCSHYPLHPQMQHSYIKSVYFASILLAFRCFQNQQYVLFQCALSVMFPRNLRYFPGSTLICQSCAALKSLFLPQPELLTNGKSQKRKSTQHAILTTSLITFTKILLQRPLQNNN